MEIAVFLAAVLARLPALNAYWCLDDWGQLARAAGLAASGGEPGARWLSQQLWWSLTWPAFGLSAQARAVARILLHAVAALTVTRIGRRAGLTPLARMVAGLLFAATPIAFTPLFWASGIQELLAGLLALLAVERWLARGRPAVVAAGLCGAGSILAKEAGFALPLLFAGLLVSDRRSARGDRGLRWGVTLLLLLVVIVEGALVRDHFAPGLHDRYRLGGPLVVLGNLGKFGWWLATPGPVFTGQVTWPMAGAGVALFAAWGGVGGLAARRGRPLPLVALLGALASVAPALTLVHQARPYMGYLAAAAGALTVASLLPVRWPLGRAWGAGLVAGALLWGNLGMHGRIATVEADGLPADPVVRASVLSLQSVRDLQAKMPPGSPADTTRLVIFQQPLQREEMERARREGPLAIRETPRYKALGGTVGLRLAIGVGGQVNWVNSLLQVPPQAVVFCETSNGFEAWGRCRDALLYASLLDVLVGDFETAGAELLRATGLEEGMGRFAYDRDLLKLPDRVLARRAAEFLDWAGTREARGQSRPEEAIRLRNALSTLLVLVVDDRTEPVPGGGGERGKR